ncbi:Hypothetical predicted protein [Mytilus galloprovincialis]|uniref:Uncharacterized protein n=1 Tax=Mytilus galloprovincialis TaxID=29158 RepID=A0A8B6H256_MYTGA|nr:Hypothetical predicted protein [Mytilus galloprovincialis]
MLPYVNTAYELSCPPTSHWTLRAEGLCTIGLAYQYYCLWDTNSKSYTESCSEKPDVAPKGRKYIVEGSPTFVPCLHDRYQPITFYRNTSSHCILLKSLCAEMGQVLAGHGSTDDDVSCRCDYRQGFDYVVRPKDICHCNPTQEDCSCVQKQCVDNRYLSAEHEINTKNSLERQVIGNWRNLKQTINHDLMLRSLVKAGIIRIGLEQDLKTKSPNLQKNHYLICLIRNGSMKTCLRIFRRQGKSTMQVLKVPVLNPKWSKRSTEHCRQQLDKYKESLLEFFNPDQVLDNFLESFIFDINDYEEILKCEDSMTMKQCFIEKVEDSLHKGSFECLLKVLQDDDVGFLSEELKTGLCQAISCNCKDGVIYSNCKVSEDNYEVNLTLSSVNVDEEIHFEFWNSTCDCLIWLVKTFAVFPITSFVAGSATFDPLSDTTLKRLIDGSECGIWSHFIETVFDNEYLRNTLKDGNDLIEINVSINSVSSDGKQEKLSLPYSKEDNSFNIITANRTFLKSNIDANELIRDFSEKRQTLFQECDGIPEIDQKSQTFVNLLGKCPDLSEQFILVLKKKPEKNKKILDRLHTFQKVFGSNADSLPDNITYHFPELISIADDFENMKNLFVERDILCKELDMIKEKCNKNNNRHKMIVFVIAIVKSGCTRAMRSLVDALFMYEHDSLAECLLNRKENTIEVADKYFKG